MKTIYTFLENLNWNGLAYYDFMSCNTPTMDLILLFTFLLNPNGPNFVVCIYTGDGRGLPILFL